MKGYIMLCLFLFTGIGISIHKLHAQDVSYTQFMTNPLYVNPALSGKYNGSFRLSGNYRDYGIGKLDNPLKSFSLSGDMRFELPNQFQAMKDIASFGFIFQSNQVAVFDYNKNNVSLVGAYQKALGSHNEQYLGIGFGIGVLQKSVNFEDITFSDQFNAIDGYTLPTGELLPKNNVAIVDLSLGLDYSIALDQSKYTVGVAWHHLNGGNLSFYKADPSTNPDLNKTDKVWDKWTAYATADFDIGYAYYIQPRVILNHQKKFTSVLVGSNFKLIISKPKATYFHVGPWVRITTGIDGIQVPTVALSTAMEFNAFSVGLSYDYGISHITSNLLNTNSLEISFQYFGEVDDTDQFYPKF